MKNTIRYCCAFPGRDAIKSGLNHSFYLKYEMVRDIFHAASDYCGKDIAAISYGKQSIARKWLTICLVTHCFAIYQIVKERYGVPETFAGYSQGEFTACAAAGVFGFPDVLGLVSSLEAILEEEGAKEESMYRIVGISAEKLDEICNQVDSTGENVCVSAYISDLQNIISGKNDLVRKVIDEAKKNGARWAINIQADRGYHSYLCTKEAGKAKPIFDKIALSMSCEPVFSCFDGKKSTDPLSAKDRLSRQIDHPILWDRIVNQLIAEGINQLIEIGPGCTVSGNTRICNEQMSCRWIGTTEELQI